MEMYTKSFKVKCKNYKINKNTVFSNFIILAMVIFCWCMLDMVEKSTSIANNITATVNIETSATSKPVLNDAVIVKPVEVKAISKIVSVAPIVNKAEPVLDSNIDIYYDRFINVEGSNKKMKKSWINKLYAECIKNDLPFELMIGIMLNESSGYPRLVNKSSKATGLFQVMPGTHGWLSRTYFKDGTSFSDMKNPYINIEYGCKLMSINRHMYKSNWTAFYSFGGCRKKSSKRRYTKDINIAIKQVTHKEIYELL